VEIYVKNVYVISIFCGFQSRLNGTLNLPASPLQTERLMTSQSRSHSTQTYSIFMFIYALKIDEKSRLNGGF